MKGEQAFIHSGIYLALTVCQALPWCRDYMYLPCLRGFHSEGSPDTGSGRPTLSASCSVLGTCLSRVSGGTVRALCHQVLAAPRASPPPPSVSSPSGPGAEQGVHTAHVERPLQARPWGCHHE